MEQIHLFKKEIQRKYQPKEWKVVALRECPTPDRLQMCDTPDKAAEYWRMHVATSPQFNPECECLVVIFLNTRRKVKGHQFVTIGTMDTLLVHPCEIFRTAIVANSSALLVMHNLCAATHKLCYVKQRLMFSPLLASPTFTRSPQREGCYARN